ncbi:MAG: A/G-specific adenine glycosylase [Anaerolineales bacterium]|jgi:A/G-specific adenine glycosylase
MTAPLASRLLSWYARHARRLPWRDHPDPYAVWVSEIMLQQTRVETVIPYFERWMNRFPSLLELAAADLQDVLNQWEGLGYYSRARNLHRAAGMVMAEYGGELPHTAQELRRLPGIGRYTAGAIASLAFGQDEAALDGNIRRVLARVFNVSAPDQSPEGQRRLWELAEAHLPPGKAGDYNQALMDLGAAVCTPRRPDCPICPLQALCEAYALGLQEARPVRRPRPETPHYTVTAAVIRQNGRVLIARRPEDGLLGGLWEFPGGKVDAGETLPEGLQREIQEELDAQVEVGAALGVYRHAFTHFRITLHAFECRLRNGDRPVAREHTAINWVPVSELGDYPMGKVDRQIARRLSRSEADR